MMMVLLFIMVLNVAVFLVLITNYVIFMGLEDNGRNDIIFRYIIATIIISLVLSCCYLVKLFFMW